MELARRYIACPDSQAREALLDEIHDLLWDLQRRKFDPVFHGWKER